MKLTSLTSVSRVDCGGTIRSSSRAAIAPPNPPPAMTTFQAMGPNLAPCNKMLQSAYIALSPEPIRVHFAVLHLGSNSILKFEVLKYAHRCGTREHDQADRLAPALRGAPSRRNQSLQAVAKRLPLYRPRPGRPGWLHLRRPARRRALPLHRRGAAWRSAHGPRQPCNPRP